MAGYGCHHPPMVGKPTQLGMLGPWPSAMAGHGRPWPTISFPGSPTLVSFPGVNESRECKPDCFRFPGYAVEFNQGNPRNYDLLTIFEDSLFVFGCCWPF